MSLLIPVAQAQAMLARWLPRLKYGIHDNSETVRASVITLLAKMKGLRDLKVCIVGTAFEFPAYTLQFDLAGSNHSGRYPQTMKMPAMEAGSPGPAMHYLMPSTMCLALFPSSLKIWAR